LRVFWGESQWKTRRLGRPLYRDALKKFETMRQNLDDKLRRSVTVGRNNTTTDTGDGKSRLNETDANSLSLGRSLRRATEQSGEYAPPLQRPVGK
jgi:hypothetical protein